MNGGERESARGRQEEKRKQMKKLLWASGSGALMHAPQGYDIKNVYQTTQRTACSHFTFHSRTKVVAGG